MSKLLAIIVAFGLAIGLVAPVLAADKMPTTNSACENEHMKWDCLLYTSPSPRDRS